MPQSQAEKQMYQVNMGLHTESSELGFPAGYTKAEANYTIEKDGSRRRRKGIQQEASGANKTITAMAGNEVTQSFLWKNVGGDPSKRFWVHKLDSQLYFTDDSTAPSAAWHSDNIELDDYQLTGNTDDIANLPIGMTQGRGDLFVSCSAFFTLQIKYDVGTDSFTVRELNPQIRDYTTIEDDTLVNYEPDAAAGTPAIDDADLTDDHYYNLRNRGWKDSDIVAYAGSKARWPSRVMQWWRGYRRQTDVSYSDLDGIQVFDSNKMEAEATANSSAPVGSLFIRIKDDTVGYQEVATGEGTMGQDPSPTLNKVPTPWELTVNDVAHSKSIGQNVSMFFGINYTTTGGKSVNVSYSDTYEITATAASTWTVEVPIPADYASGGTIVSSIVLWTDDRPLDRSTGTGPLTEGPRAVQFHDGRLWMAGINDPAYADHIFYTQVVRSDRELERCHMEFDPTDPNNNTPLDTDGGYVVIPGIGNIKTMISIRNGLLVFSDEGVWELAANRGPWTPNSGGVRKLTGAECVSPLSPIIVDETVMYASPKGWYIIAPNQYTGVLEAQNITQETIQGEWLKITQANLELLKSTYDDAKRQVLLQLPGTDLLRDGFTAGDHSTALRFVNTVLGLDLNNGAWFKWEFKNASTASPNAGLYGIFAISEADGTDRAKKLKFLTGDAAANRCVICDMDTTDYLDYGPSGREESPLPFLHTGDDTVGDFQRRKQAPIITVFSKRTETGYTSTGSGWTGDNESSTTMTAYWDWTDDSVSGKIGSSQQVYRHNRAFVPASADDVNGYPVVVTRNKVRGRGRALSLRFEGAAGKDSHILGFHTNYKVSRPK